MVWKKSQTYFSDRSTSRNSMFSIFCHVLSYCLLNVAGIARFLSEAWISGKPSLLDSLFLLAYLLYRPERRESDDAEQCRPEKRADSHGCRPCRYAKQQECRAAAQSEIVVPLDDKRVEESDDEECAKSTTAPITPIMTPG